jgi:hypothetical protein
MAAIMARMKLLKDTANECHQSAAFLPLIMESLLTLTVIRMGVAGQAILIGLAESAGTLLNTFAASVNPIGVVSQASDGLSNLVRELNADKKSSGNGVSSHHCMDQTRSQVRCLQRLGRSNLPLSSECACFR